MAAGGIRTRRYMFGTNTAAPTSCDRLGYDGFFMPEAWGYDMTVLLAEAAVR